MFVLDASNIRNKSFTDELVDVFTRSWWVSDTVKAGCVYITLKIVKKINKN